MAQYKITQTIELSNEEAGFIQTMGRQPGFWAISINAGGGAAIRKSLKDRGLVAVSRNRVAGIIREKGVLTELGRAALAAIRESVASIEV